MIIKSFELNKINLEEKKLILLYGKNEGQKNETISYLIKNNENISRYEEKEILENSSQFLEDLWNKSLFNDDKCIIIRRASDKIIRIIEQIEEKNHSDIRIIINSDVLEKKSKLRIFFEKSKKNICIPFYEDNTNTLSKIAHAFLMEKEISLSQADINLVVEKCNGDRGALKNELKKIEFYSKNKKKINSTIIEKLINLQENRSISELIDNCLAKNKKKIITILNENNYSKDDCILITRTFLNKSKKLLQLTDQFHNNNNIDLTISSAKPPIFWKDKEITKQQIYKWSPKKIRLLIYDLSKLELIIKKNFESSVNLITDFLLEKSSTNSNN